MVMSPIFTLKKRPFPQRLINSYRAWRQNLGVWPSLRAAWSVSQTKPAQKQPQSPHYDPKLYRR